MKPPDRSSFRAARGCWTFRTKNPHQTLNVVQLLPWLARSLTDVVWHARLIVAFTRSSGHSQVYHQEDSAVIHHVTYTTKSITSFKHRRARGVNLVTPERWHLSGLITNAGSTSTSASCWELVLKYRIVPKLPYFVETGTRIHQLFAFLFSAI
jgi:hypothetical protein